MSKQWNYSFLFILIGIALCSSRFQAMGEPIAGQPQDSIAENQQYKPVPLPHLYWHFLVYVNTLDKKAAELESQGKDGSWLRNDLQKRTDFSDREFATVREASRRLTNELKALNEQGRGNAAAHQGPISPEMGKALGLKREALINGEIAYLTQSLSPGKKASLDAFLTQFFSSKPVSVTIPATQLPAPAAVQQ